uniref:Vacuolar ATP synthase subunit E n=1 Tax=Panagrolaimus sp. ES5 TaxID=591445 RepID=A0AC34FFU8_9BILA
MSFIRGEQIDDFIELENLRPQDLINDPTHTLLRPILSHIDAEAEDKSMEMELRAEEEFRAEKRRIFKENRERIDLFYERKRKQVDIAHKVYTSNKSNESRVSLLIARDQLLQDVLKEAQEELKTVSGDKEKYPKIIKGLILQGILQLLEPEVVLRCRKEDVELIKDVVDEVADDQKKIAGFSTKVTVDPNNFLSDEIAGGVELLSRQGKISVSSTLESRMNLIAEQIVPQIRTALFGPNPNRAFFD